MLRAAVNASDLRSTSAFLLEMTNRPPHEDTKVNNPSSKSSSVSKLKAAQILAEAVMKNGDMFSLRQI